MGQNVPTKLPYSRNVIYCITLQYFHSWPGLKHWSASVGSGEDEKQLGVQSVHHPGVTEHIPPEFGILAQIKSRQNIIELACFVFSISELGIIIWPKKGLICQNQK